MFKVGHKMRFTDEDGHDRMPWCYPIVGRIGTIIKVASDRTMLVDCGTDGEVEYDYMYNSYAWWCSKHMVEAEDD